MTTAAEIKEYANARAKLWYRDNRERAAAAHRAYSQRTKKARNLALAERRKTDPGFRLISACRTAIGSALRRKQGVKLGHTIELLGCTLLEFQAHLEKQFRPGMAWENHGPVWHIDHIRPCASFDFTDPAQQRECFHYMNLQPLFAEENRKKGARY